MKKYKCIKAFSVPRFDEYEEEIEGKSFYVRKGSKWEESEDFYPIDAEIILLKDNGVDWLGISNETLAEHFIEIINKEEK